MGVGGNGLGELGEIEVHHELVGIGQDEGEGRPGRGLDGTEDVGPFEALVAAAGRAFAFCPPAMAQTALLADPCLVLEPERDPLVRMSRFCCGQRGGKPPF